MGNPNLFDPGYQRQPAPPVVPVHEGAGSSYRPSSGLPGTSSVRSRLFTLRRIIKFTESRNRVRRNVAALAEPPEGTQGRPSKAFALDQGKALLRASKDRPIHAYIAMSLFTGVRTEEPRPLE